MRVVRSAAATVDIREAAVYYRDEVGLETALQFIDDIEDAVRQIATYPGSGATRYAESLSLPGLRSLALRGFPYIIFYWERDDHIDVWRLLHGHRDIPQTLLT